METKKRRSTKIILIDILLLIIIGVCIAMSTLIILDANNINKDYNELKNNLNELKKEVNDKKEKLNDINKTIADYEKIDSNIESTKLSYYSNIKKLEDLIVDGKSDKKIAYLTIDDGPYFLSYEFLKVLDKYDILATFFTIGTGKKNCYDNKSIDCYPLYQEEAKRGHTMANHTFSHAINGSLYKSADNFIEQVKKQEQLIEEQTGVKTNIVRFPGGSGTAGKLKNDIIAKLRENGYGWADWTSSIGDGGNLKTVEQGMSNFKNSINSKIEVILMHDYSRVSLKMLPDMIKYLRDNGYYLFPLFYESRAVNK